MVRAVAVLELLCSKWMATFLRQFSLVPRLSQVWELGPPRSGNEGLSGLEARVSQVWERGSSRSWSEGLPGLGGRVSQVWERGSPRPGREANDAVWKLNPICNVLSS